MNRVDDSFECVYIYVYHIILYIPEHVRIQEAYLHSGPMVAIPKHALIPEDFVLDRRRRDAARLFAVVAALSAASGLIDWLIDWLID